MIKKSFRTLGEAFGLSKDQIQKVVKRNADVLEEFSENSPSYTSSRCLAVKLSMTKPMN